MNTLREAVDDYLRMRRHLGFKLHEAGLYLSDFVTFMEQHEAPFVTRSLALAWAQRSDNVLPSAWGTRLGHVRSFARHRQATDPRTEVPEPGLLRFPPKRAKPYLYPDAQILGLMEAALDMPSPNRLCTFLPRTYYCLFGLLAVSGLRVSEVRSLELRDVDLDAGVLTVRESKCDRTRLVPLHATTREVLADYIDRRKRHWADRPVSNHLFVSSRGTPLDGARIRLVFHRLSRRIGLRGEDDSHGPRIHDLRHTFATRTLVNWYRCGKDPERLLPVLSDYLRHVCIANTQYYLEGSPELMREAMGRLESRWEVQS